MVWERGGGGPENDIRPGQLEITLKGSGERIQLQTKDLGYQRKEPNDRE